MLVVRESGKERYCTYAGRLVDKGMMINGLVKSRL